MASSAVTFSSALCKRQILQKEGSQARTMFDKAVATVKASAPGVVLSFCG
jgi:hypothetical protein